MPPGGSCLERAARSLTRSDGGVLRGPEESAPAPRLPPWLSREEAAPRPPPLPARIGEHRPPSKSTAGTLREAGCGRRCPHGHLWAPMGTQAAGQQLYMCTRIHRLQAALVFGDFFSGWILVCFGVSEAKHRVLTQQGGSCRFLLLCGPAQRDTG